MPLIVVTAKRGQRSKIFGKEFERFMTAILRRQSRATINAAAIKRLKIEKFQNSPRAEKFREKMRKFSFKAEKNSNIFSLNSSSQWIGPTIFRKFGEKIDRYR